MENDRTHVDAWLGLAGTVCVVTGAGSGIGEGTAHELAGSGAHVAVLDCNGDAASSVAAQIREEGGVALAVKADVSRPNEVVAAAEQVRRELGSCHVLVNNAAVVGYGGPLMDGNSDLWNHTLEVNLTGALVCAQTFAKQMIEAGRGGSIVNVASICGHMPMLGGGAYSVSKAGLLMLTKILALELGVHRIRCNAVSPGLVRTPAAEIAYQDAEVAEARRRIIPAGRIAGPRDIANFIAFLSSERSGYLNGEDILVDGGFNQTLLTHVPQPVKPMRPR
jgi:NAD(P)-dependent dehydrogenase (short-subunit alcohol dehydrogenase family)